MTTSTDKTARHLAAGPNSPAQENLVATTKEDYLGEEYYIMVSLLWELGKEYGVSRGILGLQS